MLVIVYNLTLSICKICTKNVLKVSKKWHKNSKNLSSMSFVTLRLGFDVEQSKLFKMD